MAKFDAYLDDGPKFEESAVLDTLSFVPGWN